MTSNHSLFEDVSIGATPDAGVGDFCVGVDLGQQQDYSAIAVIRKIEDVNTGRAVFQIGHLERLPLGTIYPAVVGRVGDLMSRLRGNVECVIDSSGVGKAVADMFAIAGLPTINVTITAGDAITSEGLNFRVPKIALVSRIQALLHSGAIKIHKHLPEAQTLVAELQAFKADVSAVGHWSFNARSGKHDDLVLAVACALWRSAGDTAFAGWGTYEFYRQQFGPAAVDREVTHLPPPLEPIEPPAPPEFGYSVTPKAPLTLVTLRAPNAVSSATGLSGRAYTPDPHTGVRRMTPDDAKVMLNHGWVRVDEPAPTQQWRP
jgi:hypothetical protein